jgi:hypothetical protein
LTALRSFSGKLAASGFGYVASRALPSALSSLSRSFCGNVGAYLLTNSFKCRALKTSSACYKSKDAAKGDRTCVIPTKLLCFFSNVVGFRLGHTQRHQLILYSGVD